MSEPHRNEETLAWLERPDGSIFWLQDTCSIGRLADNQFQVDHPTVGRRHAMIEREGDGFRIVDLRSTNGTRVNGQTASPTLPLHDHDVIRLSVNVAFVFRCHRHEARPSATGKEETVLSGIDSNSYLLVVQAGSARIGQPGGIQAFILEVTRVTRRHGGEVESFWNDSALCLWKVKDPGDGSALACGIELLQLPGNSIERFCLHYGPVSQYQSDRGRIVVSDAAEFCIAAANVMRAESVGSILSEPAVRALGLQHSAHAMKTRAVAGFNDQHLFYTLGREIKEKPKTLGKRGIVFAAPESLVYFGLSRAVMDDPRFLFLGFNSLPNQAHQAAKKKGAELILVDLSLPQDLLAFGQDVANLSPEVKLLAVMTRADEEFGRRVLRAGYKGLMLRDDSPAEFLTAMHSILLGNTYLSPRLRINIRWDPPSDTPGGVMQKLTDREREVFRLMGLELSNREIANAMGLSVKTIETHISSIINKNTYSGIEEARREAKKAVSSG